MNIQARPRASHDVMGAASAAVATAVWSALPDYVRSPARRRVVRAAVVAAGATVAAADAARRTRVGGSEPDDSALFTADATMSPDGSAPERPNGRLTAALLAGGLMMTWAGLRFGQRVDDAVAAAFARRGVRHPYTATGLIWGAITPLLWFPQNDRAEPAEGGRERPE